MRSLINAMQAAVLVAIAIGVATLPAAAQTPPTPGACPAPGCDSADHAYGDGGVGFTDSGAMGDILFGDGVDLSELGIAPPPQDSEDSSPEDSEDSSPGNSGANGGASDSASENGGGMTAEEYADHMDSNAQQWDDLADQAADPADAAGWRQRAADLRAEAARARLQAARDAVSVSVSVSDGGAQAPLIGLLGPPDEAIIGNLYGLRLPADPDNLGYDALNITAEILFGTFFAARYRSVGPSDPEDEALDEAAAAASSNAARNAASVAVNVGIRSVTHGVTPMPLPPPRVETPRSYTITAGPSHYNY